MGRLFLYGGIDKNFNGLEALLVGRIIYDKEKHFICQNLIGRMTMEQKIGAMLTLGFAGTVPKANICKYIREYHCGGLRLSCSAREFGNYVNPNGNKIVVKIENSTGIRFKGSAPVCTASQYKSVLDELQACARRRPLSIPLHFSSTGS